MVRLGQRAEEVIAIRLDDINWAAADILIGGKGMQHDRMPLPADAGVAIVAYVLDGRVGDLRHSYALQGVMNGVGLTAVGKLLGHRKRATTAIYAHLADSALRAAAAQAAAVIARAMGYSASPPPVIDEADDETALKRDPVSRRSSCLY